MLKKILLTALVIFLAYLFIRWRQKRTLEVSANEQLLKKQNVAIYYLAGSLITVMLASIIAWLYFMVN